MYYCIYNSIIGPLCLIEENQKLIECSFGTTGQGIQKETVLLKQVMKELQEYFNGERTSFSIPINPYGTDFQKKVWESLVTIPYGQTRPYKEISIQVGNEKASRAIGMANHNNPIAIIVPCHRVIGTNGKMVGYAGGIEKKELLLNLEQGKEES